MSDVIARSPGQEGDGRTVGEALAQELVERLARDAPLALALLNHLDTRTS